MLYTQVLQPLSGENIPRNANYEDNARLDITAIGFLQQCEMAFFDVRVFLISLPNHIKQKTWTLYLGQTNQVERPYTTPE